MAKRDLEHGFILVTESLTDEMKFQWPKNQGEVRNITKRQFWYNCND